MMATVIHGRDMVGSTFAGMSEKLMDLDSFSMVKIEIRADKKKKHLNEQKEQKESMRRYKAAPICETF